MHLRLGKSPQEIFFVHSSVLSRPTGQSHVGESTRFVGESTRFVGESTRFVGEGEVGETTLYPRVHIASLLHSSG